MKNKKLIGLASLMLVLGATGCPKDPVCEDGKHTWGDKEVIKEATCTEGGQTQRTCTVCGAKEDPKSTAALKHDWKDDATGAVESTCTVKGHKGQTCARCGEKQVVDIPLKDHTWVDIDGGTAATCTEAGTQKQKCSVCNTEREIEVTALNHSYGDAVRTKDPTCEEEGLDKQTCTRCGNVKETPVAALGHDYELVGGQQTAATGEAKVLVKKCKRCKIEFLGFRADEVSEESKTHLNFTAKDEKGDVGASFWGRPIGNALALNADGSSVNRTDGEVVYCTAETGDFFEYKFRLNHDQAELLKSCRLYCDARPADHLSGDFWAYNSGAQDWTPGYYIDGSDEHVQKDDKGDYVMVADHEKASRDSTAPGDEIPNSSVKMGKRITDYRYVLYVGDENGDSIRQFDPDTKVTVEGSGENMVRKEYVLPYTFNLKEGLNTISLRMSGGYRSTFYNFTFRPYVEPTPITVNANALTVKQGKTVAIEGASETGVVYASSNTAIAAVDAATGVVTGVAPGKATITVSKEGNFKPAKVEITVEEKEGVIKVEAESGVTADSGITTRVPSGGASGSMIDSFPVDKELTLSVDNAGEAGDFDMVMVSRGTNIKAADVMTIKLNGTDIDLTDKTINSGYSMGDTALGKVHLNAGANTLVIKHTAGDMPNLDYFKFTPASAEEVPPQPVHDHTWVAAADPTEGATDAVVKKYTCECGLVKYEIAASTGKFTLTDDGSLWKLDPTAESSNGYFKLDKFADKTTEGCSFSFTFALPKAFTGKMYQRGYMDTYNSNSGNKIYWNSSSACNIAVTINENPIDMTGAFPIEGKTFKDVKFSDVFGTEYDATTKNSAVKDVFIGDVELTTANTIKFKRQKSLNLSVSHFVFIGTEAAA